MEVQLKRDSLLIDANEPTIGDLAIQIKNKHSNPVNCGLIKVEIPIGQSGDAKALTDTNNFSVNPDYWNVSAPPFPIVGQAVVINFINDFGSIAEEDDVLFHIYKIPILPNPEGQATRSVVINVKFFATTTTTEPFTTKSLSLELKSQVPTEPKPFVRYFAADRFFISEGETMNLYWSIANPKDMRLYPNFLSDQDERVMPRSRGMRSDQDRQPMVINSEEPILITRAVGSLQVQLVKSTQFTLVADNEGNQGISQLTAYLKSLTIIFFKGEGLQLKKPVNPGEAIVLKWLVTFSNPKALDNQLYLVSQEFDNNGKILPPEPGTAKLPIAGVEATTVRKFPNAREGQFIVYPTQPTNYVLYIYQSSNPFNKIYPIPVMINVPNSPIGSIVMYSGKTTDIPYGWALCNGATYSKQSYINQWRSVYQVQFGTVDPNYNNYLEQSFAELTKTLSAISPANQVKLPDLRNQFVAGAGSSYQPHQTGGSDMVTLKLDHIPSHNHGGKTGGGGSHRHDILRGNGKLGYVWGKQGGTKSVSAGGDMPNPASFRTDLAPNHTHGIPAQGGGKAHENRPPFYALSFIIKVLK